MKNTIPLAAALAIASALCCASPFAHAQTKAGGPAAWCARLLPEVQPRVKPSLQVFSADDAHTDPTNAGDIHYVNCDYRARAPQSGQLVVTLHDDYGSFDDAHASGYAALPGFGDHARYTTRGSMGMLWADVVRGKVACEARFAMEAGDIHGDWKDVAGKACEAALALH